jgi:threonine/homoserine efflux transporter RhtA
MVLSGIVSAQAGAGIAARLFHEVLPAAVTGLRLWTSAVAMAVIAGRRLAGRSVTWRSEEPGWRRRR